MNALCQMTGLSRAGFYRSRLPRQATPVEMEIRDEMQKIALEFPKHTAIEESRSSCSIAVSTSIISACCE